MADVLTIAPLPPEIDDPAPAPAVAAAEPRYRAFISYSHRDKSCANWLHRVIETYRVPVNLVGTETAVGPVPRRVAPIFRDRDELSASGDLGNALIAALTDSMFLIVICSPAGAVSHWVNEEILAFKRLHGEHRVLALIVGGDPYASLKPGREAEECFPRSLLYKLGPDGELSDTAAEPIAADIRPGADGRRLAKLKLVAGLTGLQLDDLARRETQRRVRRLVAVATFAIIGMVLAGLLAVYALVQRDEANKQRVIAEREAAVARAASDYLVGTFELSNPATENPRTITALTILERGAQRARSELAEQPVVQSRLLATLGKAYNNLGLYKEATGAITGSLAAIRRAGPDGAEALLTLAATYLNQGKMDEALKTVHLAETALGPDMKLYPGLRAQAAASAGNIRVANSDTKGGLAAYNRALALYRLARDVKPQVVATTLNNRGLLLSDDGQFDAAEDSLLKANTIYRRVLGDQHLVTGQSWSALAQNAFLAGKFKLAEIRIGRALAIERVVLDRDNPILADALALQGQIYQGEGRLLVAQQSLSEAVAIYRKAFGGPHYAIGIAEVYLALIEADRGRIDEALATLDDAKHNYDVSYGKIHANHGDLLVNRATILAKAGRRPEALADCREGLRILGTTLGAQSSYTKAMAATCAKL